MDDQEGLLATRADAAKRGDYFFYTGIICKNGHYSKRYTIDGGCFECKRERNYANNLYIRETLQKAREEKVA